MIKREYPQLCISQQCKLVRLSWSALYYAPVGIGANTLALMDENGRLFTNTRSSADARSRPISAVKARLPGGIASKD